MHDHCAQALELEPSSAVYEARSNANIELEKFMEAVQDASKAIELDSRNAKAYLRKGCVCAAVLAACGLQIMILMSTMRFLLAGRHAST
jgi:hypothetical protein